MIRSRLCGRGFLDNQKWAVDRHSSTAARVSQRMIVSICQCEPDFEAESWDISSAFPQGLQFSELSERSRELGLGVREEREVYIAPPANVWRHLRNLSNELIRDPRTGTSLCVGMREASTWTYRCTIVLAGSAYITYQGPLGRQASTT